MTATRAGIGWARSTNLASRNPAHADPERFGLWLDVRRKDCLPDPFEDEKAYPGVKIGARGTTFSDGSKLPVGSYFG